jgi:hypothetical protein
MSLSPRVLALITTLVLAAVMLGGWFGLVTAERSKAHSLDARIADERAKLTVAELLARSQKADKGKTTGTGLLATAMPASLQMPSILRQVDQLASASHVTVQSFTPSAATPASGYDEVPIAVTAGGRYGSVESFLHLLRTQAGATSGRIHADGRLFDVQSVDLAPGATGDAELTASIQLVAFVYTGTPLPAPDATTTTTASDATTGGAA